MLKNKKNLSENDIIYKYLKKLNFKKKETFNFKNDGAFIKKKKNKEIVVTNDTIIESIDFFKNDKPESIAQKIITYNLSDLSSMGATPYSYTLSLSLPKGIKEEWISKFSNKLFYLQKKYKIFLLGGDISKANQIYISSNFFGYVNKKLIIKREFSKPGDSIWVTGNIGESYIGLLLKLKKLNLDIQTKKYFINKYLYPKPCMLGPKIIHYSLNGIDISDGFIGDLSKLLNHNLGAWIFYSKIPFSQKTKTLIRNKKIEPNALLTAGDDYELIFTSSNKYDNKIANISKKNKIKITKIGRIIDKKGIFFDGKKIKKCINSFQYFF